MQPGRDRLPDREAGTGVIRAAIVIVPEFSTGRAYSDLTFTLSVREVRSEMGSREEHAFPNTPFFIGVMHSRHKKQSSYAKRTTSSWRPSAKRGGPYAHPEVS